MSTGVQTQVGQIVWHDLMSTDIEKAKGFYTKLFGWELEVWKPGEMDYPMITQNGQMHGGFVQLDSSHGVPSHWTAYVLVDDVDAATARAEKGGGTIHVQPTDIPEVGRFAVIGDPQGAVISAFKWESESPGSAGTFVWDELLTTDVKGAKRFYTEVFGWTTADMDMGEMGTYTIFNRGGETNTAGLMKKPEATPGPAAFWLTYMGTDDVDATVRKAEKLGATTHMKPTDIPTVGRIAVLADPTGASFGLFKPSESS